MLDLDEDALFLLEENDIDEVNELSEEEKIKLKNNLKELKEKCKENQKSEITINNKSTKEEVSMFLKHKFNFSQEAIESLDLDREIVFSLEENDINDVEELSKEEKDKLINFFKESKFLNDFISFL